MCVGYTSTVGEYRNVLPDTHIATYVLDRPSTLSFYIEFYNHMCLTYL